MTHLAPLSDQNSDDTFQVDALAAYLKAVSDPLRLEILRVLAQDSFGVLELTRIFDTTQPGMSHHLKILSKAGLVASRREGNSIYYRRAYSPMDPKFLDLQTTLFHQLDSTDLRSQLQECITEIRLERAQASQEFFAANADKFHQQQDLIASYVVYADHVKDFLLSLPFEDSGCALEIGPGHGEFLEVLAQRFNSVYALDNSANMLQHAQQFAQEKNLRNIEFILGDSSAAIDNKLQVDCAVINMVLHHAPSPADIFQHVSQTLNSNGQLIITDLCRHDQLWATESCGDLWLGFDPEELSLWAHNAGLEEGQSMFFALRNGFQIQIRHFYKTREK